MFKYKLLIAYEGTSYGGWQTQPNSTCIQDLIERALKIILRFYTPIVGSGRTDAGVHAYGQTAHFTTSICIDCNKTLASLNGLLPKDIRILSLEPICYSFHARYSAFSKVYHYRLHLDPIPDPFKRRYAYHVPHPVDLSLLKEAASFFIGTHDFTSFSNESHAGAAAKNAVRTLYRIDVVEEKGGACLEFEGNGFLYKMVRNCVGTLLDICQGRLKKENLPYIFKAKDRRQAGRTAPPHGLYLIRVNYPQLEETPHA